MSAEKPSRFEVIQSALAHSREIVAAGPTEEIPIFTIEGLADTSIPLLEQLEIHEEHVINPDGESAPHIDKINTPFRRELYHQLYSSAQRGILPTRDALVFALFMDELNNGMDRREAVALTNDNIKSLTGTLGNNGVEVVSKAGHKGIYYNLPKFYKEPAEITTEPTKPEPPSEPQPEDEKPRGVESYFKGISNDKLPDVFDLFKAGTGPHAYYEYVCQQLSKGVTPTHDEIKKHLYDAGFATNSFYQIRAQVNSKINSLNPEPDTTRKIVAPEGVKPGSHQGFPVFEAPKRKEQEVKRIEHSPDEELKSMIGTLLPVEKAAATILFDRLSGNSISASDLLTQIHRACPSSHVTSYNLDNIINSLRESGISVVTSKIGGSTHYYRQKYK